MAPPIYKAGQTVEICNPTQGRLCLGKGWRKVEVPPGKYFVDEIGRNEEYWHDQDMSDGYTYRLSSLDKNSSLYGRRISIWQNDLLDGIFEQGENEY